MKILFVCLGNICRSPLAEGVASKLIEERGLDISVDSAGTSAYHAGEAPDRRSQEVLLSHGKDISHLSSRKVQLEDFYQFDVIFAMDESNFSDLKALKPSDSKAKICKMRDFDFIEKGSDVPDPYYGGKSGFEDAYQMIFRSLNNFLENK
jgi:protein-tyrosine-phosphatase